MTKIRSEIATPSATPRRPFSRILAASLAFAFAACASPPPREPPPGSVALIGLDGFEWRVALDLLHEDKLPVIRGLMEKGVFGELTVTHPTLSPIIWTSIATGVESDRHGIEGFVKGKQRATKRDGQPAELYTSADRRVKALWNILTDAGRTTYTIGWWMTFPAEPVNGVMIAQVNTITPKMRRAGTGIWKGQLVEGLDGQVYPPELADEVLAMVPEVESQVESITDVMLGGVSKSTGQAPKELLEQSLWALRADAIYRRVGVALLEKNEPFDLFAIYFGGADVVGHRFWRFAYPELFDQKPKKAHLAAVGRTVHNYYIYLDGLIGDLLERLPDDATVIVVGDHGMLPIRIDQRFSGTMLSGGHLQGPPAFFIASGPAIRKPGRFPPPQELRREDLPLLGSVLDVAPTVLALRGLPVGRDMSGKPMNHILNPAFLEKYPLLYVRSHTEPDWFESRAPAAAGDVHPTERLEQLRTLGYLE